MKLSEDPQVRRGPETWRSFQAGTLQIELRHPTHIGQAHGFTGLRGFLGRSSEGRDNLPAMMRDHRGAAFVMRVE
jgi:hypothetical protein